MTAYCCFSCCLEVLAQSQGLLCFSHCATKKETGCAQVSLRGDTAWTADPNEPKGYLKLYDVMFSNKGGEKEREGVVDVQTYSISLSK